jgi:hypothetical protein
MLDFAQRLIAYETRANNSSKNKTPGAFHVCEKLRPHLAMLMGKAGFRALLSRALTVAHAEFPWLRAVQINPDGSLAGWEASQSQGDEKARDQGGVFLVAQLLGLLVAFIGENLTFRLVREAWPKLAFKDLNLDKGDRK